MPTTPEQPEQTDTDTPTMTYRGAVAPASWGPRISPNGTIYYPEIFTSRSQILEHWKSGVIQVGDYLVGNEENIGWICGIEDSNGLYPLIWMITFDKPRSGLYKPGYWSANYSESLHRIYRNDFARENRKKQNDKKPLLTDIATLVGSIPVAAVASRTTTTVEADASGRLRSLEQEVRRLNNLISEIGARTSNDYDAAQNTISRLVERVADLVRRADTTQDRLGRVERILRDQGDGYTPDVGKSTDSLARAVSRVTYNSAEAAIVSSYNDYSAVRTLGTILVTKAKYIGSGSLCPACRSKKSAGRVMWYQAAPSTEVISGFCCQDCIAIVMRKYQDYIWDFEQLPTEFNKFKKDLLEGRITSDNTRVNTGAAEPENKRPTTTKLTTEDKPVVVSPRRAPVVVEEDPKNNNNSLAKMAPRSSPTQPGQKTPWAPSVKPRR